MYPVLILLLSFSIFAASDRPELDPGWLKLMRYTSTLFGYESEVQTEQYFFAKEGRQDPKAEYQASLESMELNFTAKDDHPICLFPGRYLYLKNKLEKNRKVNVKRCPQFRKFLKKLDLAEVSLIFSSYFISKPASAFGHTLLKLRSKKGVSRNNSLLDYGVDFSANVTTNNPFLYGVLGIAGGFSSRFNLMPFFLKIREYNDYESRDLWEFAIPLSHEELELFVAHLWDMDKTFFKYYYFTQNCSYHILRFIDAIKPDWGLLDKLSYFVIPFDTLTPFLEDKRKLKSLRKRPSLYTKLQDSLAKLSGHEKKLIQKSINAKSVNEKIIKLKKERQANVLSSLSLMNDYLYSKQIHLKEGEDVKEIQNFRLSILSKRSKVKIGAPKSSVQEKKAFLGHKTRRIRLGLGRASNKQNLYHFESRINLHDLIDYSPWYNPYSILEMGALKATYRSKDKKLNIDRALIAHVMALQPFDLAMKKLSWNFELGAFHERRASKRKLSPLITAGFGFSHIKNNFAAALFLQTKQTYSKYFFKNKYNLDIGPRLVMKYSFAKVNLVADLLYEESLTNNFDFLTTNIDLAFAPTVNSAFSLNLQRELNINKVSLYFHFYYQ